MDERSGESEEEEVIGEGIGESKMEEPVPEWGCISWEEWNEYLLYYSVLVISCLSALTRWLWVSLNAHELLNRYILQSSTETYQR